MPIIDACVEYYDSYSGETFLFVFCNALYTPAMDHNLLPPFIIRKAGIEINTMLKQHVQSRNLEVGDHSIYLKEVELQVHLLLHSIFSYFPTSKPSEDTLNDESIKSIAMTPQGV